MKLDHYMRHLTLQPTGRVLLMRYVQPGIRFALSLLMPCRQEHSQAAFNRLSAM